LNPDSTDQQDKQELKQVSDAFHFSMPRGKNKGYSCFPSYHG